jgi:ubiquinone/menaquinone biosynthesis C-methylase UbiE
MSAHQPSDTSHHWTRKGMDHEYWERRAERLGPLAAGYSDPEMEAYEDALRDAAIIRLLGNGNQRRLLDAGCGTGRWSARLAEAGWIVTGVDQSERLIAMARRADNVTYIASAIQDLDLPNSTFDAWLSVTALQHITSDDDFDAALSNLTRLLKPGGLAAMLEYAPLWLAGGTQPHVRVRTRRQWIELLVSRGYRRRFETGVRFVGYMPYMLAVRASRALGLRRQPIGWLRTVSRAVDRSLSRIPGVSLAADVRMIVFEKPAR